MFVELSATSNFTFLTGASHPEEYMARAALLGMEALAIADDNSVAGIVRAHTESKAIARSVKERQEFDAITGLICPPRPDHIPAPPSAPIRTIPRLLPAARLVFSDAPPLTVLPQDRAGWRSLCRIISAGRLRAEKGQCDIALADLEAFPEGLHLLLWPQAQPVQGGAGDWMQTARRLTRRFAGNIHVLMHSQYDGRDTVRFDALADRACDLGLPTLASAAPRMHHGARRKLADVVTAVRLKTRVDHLGRNALANGEGRLRSAADMARLFAGHEDAVARAGALAQSLTFSLDELRYEYPSEITDNETPGQRLERLAYEGLKWRYPAGAPEKAQTLLRHELPLIAKLKYAPYFLTVRDIEATVAFYKEALDIDTVTFAQGRRALVVGEQKVNLHTLGMETRNHAALGAGDLCLLTDAQPEQVIARLQSAGARNIEGPVPRSGARGPITSIYFTDPDGHLIEVSRYD